MQLAGYHTLEELAEILNLPEGFLLEMLEADAVQTLFLCGEHNWFSRDIQRFIERNAKKIAEQQALMLRLQRETTQN